MEQPEKYISVTSIIRLDLPYAISRDDESSGCDGIVTKHSEYSEYVYIYICEYDAKTLRSCRSPSAPFSHLRPDSKGASDSAELLAFAKPLHRATKAAGHLTGNRSAWHAQAGATPTAKIHMRTVHRWLAGVIYTTCSLEVPDVRLSPQFAASRQEDPRGVRVMGFTECTAKMPWRFQERAPFSNEHWRNKRGGIPMGHIQRLAAC